MTKVDIERTNLTVLKQTHPAFFDPSALPWTPWVMEGTYFKLLNIDKKTGGSTVLLKVDASDESAPVHGHIGGVEGIILDGEFGYGDDRGGKWAYFYEEGGVRHQPDTPGGTIMFAIAYGPIVGYAPDGSVAAVVDAKTMYDIAAANGAAAHLSHLAQFPK